MENFSFSSPVAEIAPSNSIEKKSKKSRLDVTYRYVIDACEHSFHVRVNNNEMTLYAICYAMDWSAEPKEYGFTNVLNLFKTHEQESDELAIYGNGASSNSLDAMDGSDHDGDTEKHDTIMQNTLPVVAKACACCWRKFDYNQIKEELMEQMLDGNMNLLYGYHFLDIMPKCWNKGKRYRIPRPPNLRKLNIRVPMRTVSSWGNMDKKR